MRPPELRPVFLRIGGEDQSEIDQEEQVPRGTAITFHRNQVQREPGSSRDSAPDKA